MFGFNIIKTIGKRKLINEVELLFINQKIVY